MIKCVNTIMSYLLGMKCIQKGFTCFIRSLRVKCYRLIIEQKLGRKLNLKSKCSNWEFYSL